MRQAEPARPHGCRAGRRTGVDHHDQHHHQQQNRKCFHFSLSHARSSVKLSRVNVPGDLSRMRHSVLISTRTTLFSFRDSFTSVRDVSLAASRGSRHCQTRKESKLVCCSGALSIRDYLYGRSMSRKTACAGRARRSR